MITKELVVIGAGPAGLAAAIEAKKHGVKDILLVERDSGLGEYCNSVSTMVSGFMFLKRNLQVPNMRIGSLKSLKTWA